MDRDKGTPLTVEVFTKYLMRLEETMATKADIDMVASRLDKIENDMATKSDIADMATKSDIDKVWTELTELTSRLDKIESGSWSRMDEIMDKMATKDDLASVKEDTTRIRKAMAEDDADVGKLKKMLGMTEGSE